MDKQIKCDLTNYIIDSNDMLLNHDIHYDESLRLTAGNIYQLKQSKVFDLLKINSTFLNRYNGKIDIPELDDYEIFDYTVNDSSNTTSEFDNINFAKISSTKLYLMNYKLSHKNMEHIFDDLLDISENVNYVIYIQSLADPLLYDLIFILKIIFSNVILIKDNDWLKDTFKIYCKEATKIKEKLALLKRLNKILKQKDPDNLPYHIYKNIPDILKQQIIIFMISCYNEVIHNAGLIYASYNERTYINKYEKMLMSRKILINQ